MMFDLYPDILTVIPPGDATTDPSGDYDPAPVQETEYAICRAVRNGSGQVVRLQGGDGVSFQLCAVPSGRDACAEVGNARAGVFPPGKRTGGQRLCGRFCFGSLGMQTVDMKIVRGAVPSGGCGEKTRDET